MEAYSYPYDYSFPRLHVESIGGMEATLIKINEVLVAF